ncbi:LIM domain-containing protein A-like [Eriocheir sinensis]|uniref:LIM domain-containing protein A-like n=1 Tax=Eriocheir sinensis TaxID=95602 RepID=UPI0021C9FFB4|nr:LIM domain-containing protein A-like [Eriocheir sinensis]
MFTPSPVPGFSPGSTQHVLGPERANSENPERFDGKAGDSGRAGPTNDQTKAYTRLQKGNITSGQDTVGHSGLFSASLQHGEALQTSPGQGVSRPLDGTLKEGSQRDRLSPTTPKTSHPSPTPSIQYFHPSEVPSQSPPTFLPHHYQQYTQKPSSHSLPTHYFNPNQQGSPTLTDPPSYFSTSQTPPSSAHNSYPAVHHQTSFPRVSPIPFSGPDQSYASLLHLKTSEPSMLRNQSSPSNPDRESSALSPHLSHLLPHPPALPPGHLVLGSLEHQQPSLEIYETYDSSVREELDFSRLANVPPRGSSSAIDSPPVTHEHRDFFSGAVPTRGQQSHQHQHQSHYSHQHQGVQHQQQLRGRRSALPHATPGNVIEPLLAACRAGAQRDVNAKCRDTVLPAATVLKREVRAAPPVPPRPTCPEGQAYGRNRSCMSGSEAINSINAFNLGK